MDSPSLRTGELCLREIVPLDLLIVRPAFVGVVSIFGNLLLLASSLILRLSSLASISFSGASTSFSLASPRCSLSSCLIFVS